MIQRIQTLYLLLASACLFAMYGFSFAKVQIAKVYFFDHHGLMDDGKELTGVPFGIIIGILGAFTLVSLLMYKNRQLQLKMGRLNYILHLILIVGMFIILDQTVGAIPNGDVAAISYGIGFYLPVVAFAFIFLANRAIKKDEELVRSLDRLR